MARFQQGKRRIMEDFTLGEISIVDKPAQGDALVRIAKMDSMKPKMDGMMGHGGGRMKPKMDGMAAMDGEDYPAFRRRMMRDKPRMTEKQMENAFNMSNAKASKMAAPQLLTGITDGHQHGVKIMGGGATTGYAAGPDDQSHDHAIAMVNGECVVAENHGHSHELDSDKVKEVMMMMMTKNGGLSATDDGESDDGLAKQVAALTAANEELAALLDLPDSDRNHYRGLSDKAEKSRFLGLSAASRTLEIAKAADGDPVVFRSGDGGEYRKSDDPRMVELAKAADAARKESALVRAKFDDAELEKRAYQELPSFPGSIAVRKAILKSLDSIQNENVRDEARVAIRSHVGDLAASFATVGFDGQPEIVAKGGERKAAEARLEQIAKSKMAAGITDYYEAYQAGADENPDLAKAAIAG